MNIEEVLRRENMQEAFKRVKQNQGAPGVDGMTVDELAPALVARWEAIRKEILEDRYQPQPVRKVEIPKPDGKGMRTLGIPTVIDRLIQQAMLQVLQPHFDATFSDGSFGFRPGRSAHQAIERAREHIADGYRWVVDMDLEKFFDRVNHDVLMSRLARRIEDKQILHLIRRYLTAGMMEGGLVSERTQGTPPRVGRFRRSLATPCSMSWTRNWSVEDIALPGMPTTATSPFSRRQPGSGSWHRWSASYRRCSA